ncbi:MAG: ASCH domain-containing protein [Cytophagaceae bacterium]|nr:ASCH domain-containing protein [Gemmatimonadaceae bacterium]
MLFRQDFLAGIKAGTITLAFRRWKRPTVRAHGTLLTAVGQLQIGEVTRIDIADITTRDAKGAGFATRAELVDELNAREDGEVYRVELGALGPDPRIALRATTLSADDAAKLTVRLDKLDKVSSTGPWTRQTLDLIRKYPGRRAGDLCEFLDMEKPPFKVNVRKLKAMGLTESLEVGYRLSPRAEAYLAATPPRKR